MLRTALLVVSLGALAAPSAADTWVVDAAGGGDFLTIQSAVDAAASGDVLLVAPGNYAAFSLGKDLAILGMAPVRPRIFGTVSTQAVQFRLAGLRMNALEIRDVDGVALVDDVLVDGELALGQGCDHAMLVEDSRVVHVTRSVVLGKQGDAWCEGPGLAVENSSVTFTGGEIVGGTGWGDDFWGYDGRPALVTRGSARITVSGADMLGGHAGTPLILFGGGAGSGAPAMTLDPAGFGVEPRIIVRGNASHLVSGGLESAGIGSQPAFSVATGQGRLTFSGAQHWPESLGGSQLTIVEPAPAEPFAVHTGGSEGGDVQQIDIFGPAGGNALLLIGTAPAQLSLPAISGALSIDPAALVLAQPFAFAGQDAPVSLVFDLPSSLVGFENALVLEQGLGAGLGPSGQWLSLSPVMVLLRGE